MGHFSKTPQKYFRFLRFRSRLFGVWTFRISIAITSKRIRIGFLRASLEIVSKRNIFEAALRNNTQYQAHIVILNFFLNKNEVSSPVSWVINFFLWFCFAFKIISCLIFVDSINMHFNNTKITRNLDVQKRVILVVIVFVFWPYLSHSYIYP